MAEYKSKYTLADKQAALSDAIRRMEPVHQHWRVLESLYRTGAQREITQLDISRILPFPVPGAFLRTVNMLLPHLTLVINSVAARDPKFIITPVGGDPLVVETNSVTAKAVLDYFWKRSDATSVLRDMTQDMVICGNAFSKVGWAYSESTRDRTSEEVAVQTDEAMAAAQEMGYMESGAMDQELVDQIVEAVSLTEHIVETDEPYVEYVAPYDMFLPADARRMNTARWVCQRIRVPKDEVESNDMFNKKAVENLRADTSYMDPATIDMLNMEAQNLPSTFAYVTVFEFYDMRDRTLCIFQKDAEVALYEGPIPYAHRYPPFVHMRNFSDGGSTFWGFGDVENVAGIQLMINEIMNAEIQDLKRVGNKYFINRKVLTPEVIRALQEAKPDQVIPIDLPNNVTIGEVLQPVQRLATPQDNYYMEDKLQGYVQQILGISDLQAGSIRSASRVPATAVASLDGAQTTRSMEKMVNVEKASREIGTRVLALCQQFLDEGKAIRIAGPNAPTWLQVSAEDIDGEFSVEAEGGSTQAINPAARAGQGLDILNNIVPALTNLGYDPSNAVRTAITYMGLNPDHLLVRPEPQPEQQQPEQQAQQPEQAPEGYHQMPDGSMMADAEMGGMQDPMAGMMPQEGMMGGEGLPPEIAELAAGIPPEELDAMLQSVLGGQGNNQGGGGLPPEVEQLASGIPPEELDAMLESVMNGEVQ